MKHGLFKGNKKAPREYWIWVGIKQRCNNHNNWAYPFYGGRGITVCSEWIDDYERFIADMGNCPTSSHSIDRINNDAGYFKENCRWATPKEQADNRSNKILIDGLSIEEICKLTGMKYSGVYARYQRGWHIDQIATTPKVTDGKRKTNRFVEIGGVSKTLTEWAKESGLSVQVISRRLKAGYEGNRIIEKINSSRKGFLNHQAKLTKEQIVEIKASTETNIALAKKYSVTDTTISNVRLGKTWA